MASGTGREHSWEMRKREGVACQKLHRMDRLRDPTPRVKLFASRSASDALSQRCPKQLFQVRKKAKSDPLFRCSNHSCKSPIQALQVF